MKHETVKLICDNPHSRARLEKLICNHGLQLCDTAKLTIIVETNAGEALLHLEQHTEPAVIVITSNPCSAYRLDVLATQKIAAFIISGSDNDLCNTIKTVLNGKTALKIPTTTIAFTKRERQILRLVADGAEDNDIAQNLQIKGTSVRNYVSSILSKVRAEHPDLTIQNRSHLNLYYWGQWQVLKHRKPKKLETP